MQILVEVDEREKKNFSFCENTARTTDTKVEKEWLCAHRRIGPLRMTCIEIRIRIGTRTREMFRYSISITGHVRELIEEENRRMERVFRLYRFVVIMYEYIGT